jgi:hypothetical protein
VGPRAGLDRCGKSHPHQDSIPDRLARSQSLYRLSYPAHINLCTIFYLVYEFGLNIIHKDVITQAKIMLLNSSVILHVLPIAVLLDQNRQFFPVARVV